MKNIDLLPVRNYIGLFFLSITIVLIVKIVFNMLALGFIDGIWDLSSIQIFNDLNSKEFKFIYAHKALAFFDQLGTFLVPSVIFLFLLKTFSLDYRTPNKVDLTKCLLYFVVLLGVAQLFLLISNYVGFEFLPIEIKNFLKEQQDFNTKIQEGFISESFKSFLFNILLLSILPAIGEELFFRGILQKICIGIFKNNIAGIGVTSLVFGMLHFQIENLLSIIFASILLGLIYDYSKNILLTILLHFGFNLFSLISMQGIKMEIISENNLVNFSNYVIIPLGLGMLTYLIIKKIFWKKDLFLSVD
ncbi:CPBP family intramembrane metalloprotease [bacterium]|nr:CPBP family intramembrane metalloprotease [bacterium]|tara:strand:- start:368 stop:1276 length:909 start_codon:yes stop_codon:yes gene_type:complete